jgi:hypothetical protein
MARVKILLVAMFVLSLCLMSGGCISVGHERRDDQRNEWREQQSEHERSDRDRDKNSEERHEERH